jgi:hypothetical protein
LTASARSLTSYTIVNHFATLSVYSLHQKSRGGDPTAAVWGGIGGLIGLRILDRSDVPLAGVAGSVVGNFMFRTFYEKISQKLV